MKKLSRQRKWQIKQKSLGRCTICGGDAEKTLCAEHSKKNIKNHDKWVSKNRPKVNSYSKKWMRNKRNGLDYKKMLTEIDALVETDFCFDMDLHNLPESKPYTQKEAQQMCVIITSIYSIAHCIHCTACQRKFLKKT